MLVRIVPDTLTGILDADSTLTCACSSICDLSTSSISGGTVAAGNVPAGGGGAGVRSLQAAANRRSQCGNLVAQAGHFRLQLCEVRGGRGLSGGLRRKRCRDKQHRAGKPQALHGKGGSDHAADCTAAKNRAAAGAAQFTTL